MGRRRQAFSLRIKIKDSEGDHCRYNLSYSAAMRLKGIIEKALAESVGTDFIALKVV